MREPQSHNPILPTIRTNFSQYFGKIVCCPRPPTNLAHTKNTDIQFTILLLHIKRIETNPDKLETDQQTTTLCCIMFLEQVIEQEAPSGKGVCMITMFPLVICIMYRLIRSRLKRSTCCETT